MSAINKIKVYATAPHDCSYLSDREATTLFIDPDLEIDHILYTEVNDLGFRRSGKHFYKPYCRNCTDCIATRIPIDQFSPTRRQKRIINKNRDLQCIEVDSIDSEEHYTLYERYITLRHGDGDMYPPSRTQYLQFIGAPSAFSRFIEFRLNGVLLAVSVFDEFDDNLSAIYSFFEPESNRSLGVYIVLWLIELARAESHYFVYLGYWIKDCQKMAYKIEYRPIQLRINGRWQTLN